MRRPPLSIRTILLLTVSLLTALIAAMAVREVNTQWHQLVNIRTLKEATFVSEHFFDALEHLSRERETTYAMLQTQDASVRRYLRPRMESSRHTVDLDLQQITEGERLPLLQSDTAMPDAIERQRTDLKALRAEVDRSISQPDMSENEASAQLWFNHYTIIINHTFEQWMGFTRQFTEIDPIVTQRMMFQHFLGLIIRYSGRERAMISGMIAAKQPVNADIQAKLLRWRGVVDEGWEMCARLAERSRLAPAITPYLREAQGHYLTVYDMVHGLFYIPGAKPVVAYPISIEQWLEIANDSTDSLVALKNAALKQTHAYVEILERTAQRAILLNICILIVALLLCLFSFQMVTRRVIDPIRRMIDALLDTIAGKSVAAMPVEKDRGDEIGQLANVLFSLQKYAENSRLLASIVESSEDAILSKTLDGIITTWNHGAERMFGYMAAEVIGKHISIIIPADRSEEERTIIAQLRTGVATEHFETVRVGKDGQLLDISLTVSPIYDAQGKIIGASKIARNIGDRKEAERKIQESEERYRALVEAGTQVVWVWKEGAIEKMSPLMQWWEDMTGQPGENIATYGWLEVVHPDDRERVKKIWENAMQQSKNFDMEYRLVARRGGYCHVSVRGVALKNPDGSVREFIGSLNDVTDRKKAEEKLLHYMRDLERSNRELDDFAYIASHDLKEPLRGIHNHSRFLLEDNEEKLEKESVDRLNRLLYLTKRMEKLVNDLLYFSRLGRQELAIEPADMNLVVYDIETLIDVFLGERHARIMVPVKLPTVTCDKTRITEALRNLITNAVKYNDKAEKIVEIGYLDQHADLQGETVQNVFYVKDNGIGIALEFHTEIFRIFKRLQSDKNDTQEEGTGVGLTFVKKIIERHGGNIWLESQLGQGTVFYFTLGRTAHVSNITV